jgi:polyisoprenoid-binding protein YceI
MSTWNVDPSHTTVHFSVRHMMITNVRGEFRSASGKLEFDQANPAATKIEGSVDAASIQTREDKRDGHLKSPDFLDVDNHPTIAFVSREVKPSKDGLTVTGDLTIRGVAKPLVLHVSDVTPESKDPWGQTRIGATATGTIKRSDYGITWNQVLEAGGFLVGDDIKLTIDASLVKS